MLAKISNGELYNLRKIFHLDFNLSQYHCDPEKSKIGKLSTK